ncbi:hypothetical protein FRB95_011249 [Tulasnella sp. JGI-2019a]|nr:hypothetical protein FRB95_011249 [Tulasnella sp. JGI-2019a]
MPRSTSSSESSAKRSIQPLFTGKASELHSKVTGFELETVASTLTPPKRMTTAPGGNRAPSDRSQPMSDFPFPVLGKPVTLGKSYTIYQGLYGPAQTKVAIKHLRILGDVDAYAKNFKNRVEREAEIRSSLTHKNILPFYGVVESLQGAYMIYPWIEHRDLSRFLIARLQYLDSPPAQDSSISSIQLSAFSAFDEAKTIHGIASGLVYLHANGVIHGNLKAENILLDDSLTPLIIDFAFTKDSASSDTNTSMGLDAPRWTSLELLDENEHQKTEKSDIYAFGMTITEILTGHVPFHDLASSFQVFKAIVFDERRPAFEPMSRNGRSLGLLWDLAALCWKKDPMDRPIADDILRTMATKADETTNPSNTLTG